MTELKTNTHGRPNLSFSSLACVPLVAILVAYGLYAVFFAGPAMRAAAHESVVRAIADEDHQFCEMFGMHSGTDAFAACSRELSMVRQRQVERDDASAEGMR